MSTIFISHSSKDNVAAKELNVRLERQGHTCVFLDLDPEKGIVAGKSWERTLYRKLRACRAVIALCTDDYLRSHWCFAEIALARMEGKPIFALLLDPLGESSKLPSILTEKQYIDVRVEPEEGYQRLWRGLSELELLGVVGGWDPKESPYLGLGAYHEKHAPVFFGRGDESRAGVELLDRGSPGLIMTLGASGSGKSSLVRAGIIPRLRRDSDRWIIVEPFRPQTNPFLELAEALVQTYRRYAPDSVSRIGDAEVLSERLRVWSGGSDSADLIESTLTQDDRVKRLIQQLEDLHQTPPDSAMGSFLNFLDWSIEDLRRICDGPISHTDPFSTGNGKTILTDIAEDLTKVSDRCNARVLIVVDQFEELLGTDNSSQYDEEFLRLLRGTIESEGSSIMVLATMRTDFLSAFQNNSVMSGIDFESLSLGPVRAESMRKIIESPAKLGAIELQDGLTDRLLEDTHSSDALPLLSFTLWVLWRDFHDDGVLALHDYEQLDGLQGAIAREADALLGDGDEALLRPAFLEMVRISEEGTYARKVANWDNQKLLPVHALLNQFINKRLLVTRAEGNSRVIEVAHEALFYSWPPLKAWLDEHRAEMILKQEITREARAWESNDHSADILWRGGRLQQARQLLDTDRLTGVEKTFIHKSVRRQNILRGAFASIALAVFAGMAGLTFVAERERGIAIERKDALNKQYANLVWELANQPFLELQTGRAVIGDVVVSDNKKFTAEKFKAEKFEINEAELGELETETLMRQLKDTANPTLIGRPVNGGKLIAVAHDRLVSKNNNIRLFLKNALLWLVDGRDTTTEKINIVFSTGHCEVVSSPRNYDRPDFNLPIEDIERWGYSVAPISNLTLTEQLSTSQVLIIGNAWSSFSRDELDAVEAFTQSGGALLLAGLHWSWSAYKTGNTFNPCSWAMDSTDKERNTQSYPMNDLGERFGLTWK